MFCMIGVKRWEEIFYLLLRNLKIIGIPEMELEFQQNLNNL